MATWDHLTQEQKDAMGAACAATCAEMAIVADNMSTVEDAISNMTMDDKQHYLTLVGVFEGAQTTLGAAFASVKAALLA